MQEISVLENDTYTSPDSLFNGESNASDSQEIEIEIIKDAPIKVPFDATLIKVAVQPYTVGQIVDGIRANIIRLDMDFQRRTNLWNPHKQSLFIESILLKLPVPLFHFFVTDTGTREIVDGLQRITAINNFIVKKTGNKNLPLRLHGLEFLEEYEGKTFDELPLGIQWELLTTAITVSVMDKGTPENVKYNVFKRLNQGGLELTPQEIRHAIYRNGGAQLLVDLTAGATNDTKDEIQPVPMPTPEGGAFIQATQGKIKSERMEDRELVNRFVAFYLQKYDTYDGAWENWLNTSMEAVEKLSQQEIESIKYAFKQAMDTAYQIFGEDAFRKPRSASKKKPFNKALFEVISVELAQLSDSQRTKLIAKKDVFLQAFTELHEDQRFFTAISGGTAEKDSVKNRFSKFHERLMNVLS